MTTFDLPIQTLPTLEEAYGSVLGGSRMENTETIVNLPTASLLPFPPILFFYKNNGCRIWFPAFRNRGFFPADGSGIQRTAG